MPQALLLQHTTPVTWQLGHVLSLATIERNGPVLSAGGAPEHWSVHVHPCTCSSCTRARTHASSHLCAAATHLSDSFAVAVGAAQVKSLAGCCRGAGWSRPPPPARPRAPPLTWARRTSPVHALVATEALQGSPVAAAVSAVPGYVLCFCGLCWPTGLPGLNHEAPRMVMPPTRTVLLPYVQLYKRAAANIATSQPRPSKPQPRTTDISLLTLRQPSQRHTVHLYKGETPGGCVPNTASHTIMMHGSICSAQAPWSICPAGAVYGCKQSALHLNTRCTPARTMHNLHIHTHTAHVHLCCWYIIKHQQKARVSRCSTPWRMRCEAWLTPPAASNTGCFLGLASHQLLAGGGATLVTQSTS
jgi:hypothetical protein